MKHTQRVRLLVLLACGCAGPGLFTDFTSVSVGSFTSGLLRHGARLPEKGEGYLIQPLWLARNSNSSNVTTVPDGCRMMAGLSAPTYSRICMGRLYFAQI